MRDFPHTFTKSEALSAFEESRALATSLKDHAPTAAKQKYARFFKMAVEDTINLAGSEYAFEEPMDSVGEHLDQACIYAQQVIEYAFPLDPQIYIEYLCLSIIRSNQELTEYLISLATSEYTNPSIDSSPLYYSCAQLLANLCFGNESLYKEKSAQIEAELAQQTLPPVLKKSLTSIYTPLKAIIDQDETGFAQSQAIREREHIETWAQPGYREQGNAFLDIWALGFLKLALEKNIPVKQDSVYAPRLLLRN